MKSNFKALTLAAASLALAGSVFAITPVMDGTRDAGYTRLATQNSNTSFGNASGATMSGGGSELDCLYVTSDATNVYVFLAGDQESNGNVHAIYIDVSSVTAGTNPVAAAPGGIGGIGEEPFGTNKLGNVTFPAAMTSVDYGFGYKMFDFPADSIPDWAGFAADWTLGSPASTFSGNQATVAVTGTGYASTASSGPMSGFGYAIDNSNAAGVDGTGGGFPATGTDPSTVTTGTELLIPRASIGSPADGATLQIVACHVSGDGTFWSNQTLPSPATPQDHLGGGPQDLATGGKAIGTVNAFTLSATAGASVSEWSNY